ncbi:MAG: efflux RND transporter permease subunit [Calditrichia bacterium]
MKTPPQPNSLLGRIILFCLYNRLVVVLLLLFTLFWGAMVAPFDWDVFGLPRTPVPVDAIPDLGENQQIVFTKWPGRSPQDIEDQITYPMTVSLLGVPGVKTVRSFSMFGFSSIYVIFKEDVEFYWSRSRILEKLNSLPAGTLPSDVKPMLGPDATALGQVFWYTLEGRDKEGNPTGGWDLQELRTIQDWYVRYSLMSSEGISEVASVGGFVQEYQIDVDPDALRAYGISLEQVFQAVKMSNQDVGARTIEINSVEYVIRGRGFIKTIEDIENSVVTVDNNVPIFVRNIAAVTLGPALRRGALDKGGAEAVGGVAVVRYGENPMAAINLLKEKIREIEPGLPKKMLADGTESQVKIIPFYDRSGLINETLGTLNDALYQQILVTIIVVLLMVMHLRSALLISGLLPIAVLITFIAMKHFGVDANIVALSGIAIAVGTMVDMGIVITENILKHLKNADSGESSLHTIYRASIEVSSAVVTAVATTVVSFLPVFTMEAAEGKLFRPLAFTKTFALIASVVVAITIIPPLAHLLFSEKFKERQWRPIINIGLILSGITAIFIFNFWIGLLVIAIGAWPFIRTQTPLALQEHLPAFRTYFTVLIVALILAGAWLPLGNKSGLIGNFLFVGFLIGGLLGAFWMFQRHYSKMLRWALEKRGIFLSIISVVTFLGLMIWLGFNSFFGWLPQVVRTFAPISATAHAFPGLGKEFMPPLDEGSYLYMPTTMPHASIGEALDVIRKQNMSFNSIPEIESAVGKLGRAETPLDPAPISMIETIINYKSEYRVDEFGRQQRFRFEVDSIDFFRDVSGNPLAAPDGIPYRVQGTFIRDETGLLILDKSGVPFRQWRPALDPKLNDGRKAWTGIVRDNDIWDAIVLAGRMPGSTSAPRLQPIAARIVMLQSGLRAPMGVKIKGPDLVTIEKVGMQIEQLLKQVPGVEPAAVLADRIIGKPYLEIDIDRMSIARYGINLMQVQNVIEVAIGGKAITTTIEGRERYAVRLRYPRERRNSLEDIEKIFVASPSGAQIPLKQLATINYVRGPQVIKSEDTFITGYVVFDKRPGFAEVDVVQQAQAHLQRKIDEGQLQLPAGISYTFTGSYENQVRSEKRLTIILPLALFVIFLILYFQFKTVSTTSMVFSGILVAWAGGFIMIWLYGQPWFLNFSLLGHDMRTLFQIDTVNLSVAIWVGFLALFGIASDNGVIVATYLDQVFSERSPATTEEIHSAAVEAGEKRLRPALMTAATTLLALLPILTSTGRGSDIMIPMAIPSFGGMLLALLTLFLVPVLYASVKERELLKGQ